MQHTTHYQSTLGDILITADDLGLTGLWFEGEKHYKEISDTQHEKKNTTILKQATEWLTVYFGGEKPDFCPPIHMLGTPFQLLVWELLLKIPYGETITYGEIARKIAVLKGIEKMSAQAVGGAVGHNKIPIIIPCHRVVGTNNSLVGYTGGIDKKIKLLTLEKVNMNKFFVPKRGQRYDT